MAKLTKLQKATKNLMESELRIKRYEGYVREAEKGLKLAWKILEGEVKTHLILNDELKKLEDKRSDNK